MTEPKTDPPLFAFFNEIGIIEQLARALGEPVEEGALELLYLHRP